MDYIYLIIPTINGEINGDAIISLNKEFIAPPKKEYLYDEVTIYKINLKTMEVEEI